MVTSGEGGRAYLDRLQVAVDIRLIDDIAKWPQLARRADAVSFGLVRSALSNDEWLLHMAARALGGKLDEASVRELEQVAEIVEHDLPFVAIVLASRGVATAHARDLYLQALDRAVSPALDASLRLAFERGFSPGDAGRLGDAVKRKLFVRWPDTMWRRIVSALEGDDRELVELAVSDPQLTASVTGRVSAVLVATGRWRELLDRIAAERASPDPALTRRRLQLLASATAWRVPLPRAATSAAVAQPGAATAPEAVALLSLACGDVEVVRRGGDALRTDTAELTLARGIATLGGPARGVRQMWEGVGTSWSPESPTLAVLAALFALELDNRVVLRSLAGSLASYRTSSWGKVLLARVHLAAGDPALVDVVLAHEDGPVARLLSARARAATNRVAAIPVLRTLAEAHPGWSEARLRLGLALANVNPGEALAILEKPANRGDADSAALGAPATARAAALLAAGELHRRHGRADLAQTRIIEAPPAGAPEDVRFVARQATILAVALRAGGVAANGHRHLQVVAPGASVVDRLHGGMLELRGEIDKAMERYQAASAWDRIVVLGARRNAIALPAKLDLDDVTSVAALADCGRREQSRQGPARRPRARPRGRAAPGARRPAR